MVTVGVAALGGAAVAQAAAAPQWKIVYRTHSVPSGELVSVTAPASNDAWAVGTASGQPVVVKWNGKQWQALKVPGTTGFQPGEPTAVQATSTGNVWIFGSVAYSAVGQAHVWNGHAWRTIALPTSGFASNAVVSANDVWGYSINGEGCYTPPASATCLYHWNGAKWTETRLAGVYSEGMTAAGGHAWLFGLADVKNSASFNPSGVPVLYEATNGVIRKVAAPSPRITTSPNSIAAAPDGQFWIEANLATAKAPATLFHWTGRSWTASTIPGLVGGFPTVLSGATVFDGKDGVWVDPMLHWTGSKWLTAFSPSVPFADGYTLNAAAPIPGSSSIWAAGAVARTATNTTLTPLVAAYGPVP